jgi:hypothetical protein
MIKNYLLPLPLFILFSCAIAPPTYIPELDGGDIAKNKVYIIRDTGSSDKPSMVEVKINDISFGSILATEVAFTDINQSKNTITSTYTNLKNAKCSEASVDFDASPDESYYFIVFNQSPHSRLPACIQMYQTDLANFQKTRRNALTRAESNAGDLAASFVGEVILGLP